MEFHNLGENCNYTSCNQLDFLPFNCDACKGIYCKEHYTYANHQCANAYTKDNRVPSCPICNQPILIPKGSSSYDMIINRHIENQCQSDLAIVANKKLHHFKNDNKCSFKKCKQIELIPFSCKDCHDKFCIIHRLPYDHSCYKLQNKTNYINKKEAPPLSNRIETKTCDTKKDALRCTSLTFSACIIC